MPAFEWNKIFAAILLAGVVTMASALLGKALLPTHQLPKDAYPISADAAPVKVASADDSGPVPLTPQQFASADADKGSVIAHKCEACHSIGKGEAAKIGPNLWGIINNKRAHMDGFAYSDAMEKLGGKWTAQNIAAFIFKPRAYLAGTKMGFPGLPDPEQRADVIAYLNTQADSQIDLSKEGVTAAPPAAAAPAAPAAGAAAAPAAGNGPAALTAAELGAADATKGATLARKCLACHSLGKGEPAKIGPNLWGIIDNKRAHMAGYTYSDALQNLGGTWTVQNIAAFIYKPRAYLAGTKMSFPGLPDSAQRADVLAYLNKQSDSPVDLVKDGTK